MKLQEDRWPNAMAYYHPDGLKPAWDMTMRFAGENGHVATMPEIIEARLATKPGDVPWESYFTTRSAEYVGYDHDGNKKIVVAHGIGPMSTLNGIMKAYSWEYKDKTRDHRGGRITQEEFWKLLDGEYGEVSIVDFEEYVARYEYPFIAEVRSLQSLGDPLLRARLGEKAVTYLIQHTLEARKWHAEQAGINPDDHYHLAPVVGDDLKQYWYQFPHKLPRKLKKMLQKDPKNYTPSERQAIAAFLHKNSPHRLFCDRRRSLHIEMSQSFANPFIIKIGDASNCSYVYRPIEKGMAFAHLLSIGQLMAMRHTEDELDGTRRGYESLVFDVSAHEWWNGTRFVGVREGEVSNIINGPDPHTLLRKHWQKLLKPSEQTAVGFRALVRLPDNTWFTQYEKRGASLDTCEPEFQVTSMEEVGDPTIFQTKVWGYYGFFKYQIKDVQALAPVGANAYSIIGDPELVPGSDATLQRATVQFCKIEVDSTQRVERQQDIENDFDLLMSLLID